MRSWRKLLAMTVAFGMAPGTFYRCEPEPLDFRAPVGIDPLPVKKGWRGEIRLEAAWVIHSRHALFGGYSALLRRGPRDLFAISDGGRALAIGFDEAAPVAAWPDPFLRRGRTLKEAADFESVTHDPDSGTSWIGVEGANAIMRLSPDLKREDRVSPAAMSGWSANGGPEAMVRLSDGRFIVLQESAYRLFGTRRRGVLFAGAPDNPATPPPLVFDFEPPKGYAPVDMAELPDGRVLIVLRKLTFPYPPRFASALAVADPAEIRRGKAWQARIVAQMGDGWPVENFEGLAIAPLPGGAARLWLISDDNQMQHFQKTLLLRLRWEPGHAKGARGPVARP